MRAPTHHGLCVVDKPAGWTSHDVVAKCRGILGERRIGHSGTLDPDATGLLLLGVGAVTRLLRFLTVLGKCYAGEVVLGAQTSTLDASGDVVATHDMDGVTLDDIRAAATTLTGDIEQVPPMVSAIKVDGRRLHELARAGIEVERAARAVHVSRFRVEPTADPLVVAIEVECSSGTYVRSLADDLGRALGGSAHLRNLRRTRIGSFGLDEAHPMEALVLLDPAVAMRDYPTVVADDAVAARIPNGAVLARSELGVGDGEGPWAVMNGAGHLLAVYEGRDAARAKPAVVLAR